MKKKEGLPKALKRIVNNKEEILKDLITIRSTLTKTSELKTMNKLMAYMSSLNSSQGQRNWPQLKQYAIDEIEDMIFNNEDNKFVKSDRVTWLIQLGWINPGYKCKHCGKQAKYFALCLDPGGGEHLDLFGDNDLLFTIDHIIPKSKGGAPTQITNMQLLCTTCNCIKGDTLEPTLKDEVK